VSDLPRSSMEPISSSRLSVTANEDLMRKERSQVPPPPGGVLQTLPEPIFPQNPKLSAALDEAYFPKNGKRYWAAPLIYRAMRGWMFPYFQSRLLRGEFYPIISYFFTEWKYNLDCNYCWAFDNRVSGMTEDTAKRSIEWLHSTTCRVLALMGGEVLLRPHFVYEVIDYAAKQGFWVYLPTNGRLMKPDVIDRVADAGVATFNLAVHAWDIKPGLPKAMVPIRQYFNHLVRKQYKYGYSVFLNINICHNNLKDVRMLTELAHDNGIATDYHICETPMMEHEGFTHLEDNPVFIRPDDHAAIGELLDWLIEKQNSGWHMVNSVQQFGRYEEVHKERDGSLGLPRGIQQPHHPHRWHAGSLFSHVLGQSRLGNHRSAKDGPWPVTSDEERVRSKLHLYPQSHSCLLL
jgi:organic radical activating enzyme